MVYYITDGINYLADIGTHKMTKNKEEAAKYQTEKKAAPEFMAFLSCFPLNAQAKWRIKPADEEWTEPDKYYLKCEKGYLAGNLSLTTSIDKARQWDEPKASNIRDNQCATNPLLRKYHWSLVKAEGNELSLDGEYDLTFSAADIKEITYENIDAEEYSDTALRKNGLLPLAEGMHINNSRDLVRALSYFYSGITERKEQLLKERQKAEAQLQTIEHAIELNEYDAQTERMLIPLIRNIRKKRRACKDESVVINAFLRSMPSENMDRIIRDIQILEGRYYTPKAFPALFKDSDNVFMPADAFCDSKDDDESP